MTQNGTKAHPYRFAEADDGWSAAFDLCRELDRPITVVVDEPPLQHLSRIFPSGHERAIAVTPLDGSAGA